MDDQELNYEINSIYDCLDELQDKVIHIRRNIEIGTDEYDALDQVERYISDAKFEIEDLQNKHEMEEIL